MRPYRRLHRTKDENERFQVQSEANSIAQAKAGDKGRGDQPFDFGVTGPADAPVEVPSEEPQPYICADCQGEIVKGQSNCAGCGVKLNWEGIE